MRNIERILPLVAAVGFLGCAVGLWIEPKTMLASYLAAWFTVSAIPIGAIGVLLTSYLVRAGWTPDLHHPLSSAALTMPLTACLLLPVVAGIGWIYPWMSGAETLPAFKAVYLTPWFFVVRAAIYFTLWTALALWAERAYGNDAAMTRAASAGLVIWTLVGSWAGIDWLESVEPDFHSSIYGLLTVSFLLLSGLAFGIVAVLTLKRSHQMSNASYSGVLLSVLLLWAYLYAMQYIIIWAGNIPDEVVWYLKRLEGGWGYALWGLYIGQFVLPFFALLSARIRSSTSALLLIAGATLMLRYLEAVVLILPPLHVGNLALVLDLPAALAAIGATWLWGWRVAPTAWSRWLGGATAARQHE
jgi:hypothetical protein